MTKIEKLLKKADEAMKRAQEAQVSLYRDMELDSAIKWEGLAHYWTAQLLWTTETEVLLKHLRAKQNEQYGF